VTLDTGWIFTDIPPYRGGEGMFNFYSDEDLPPLPTHLFAKGYEWLPTLETDETNEGDEGDVEERDYMTPIDAEAALERLDVPESFRAFMSRRELLASIPSNTACWWTLSPEPIPSPLGDGATMVNFLNDQQYCVLWYLYLWPDGRHGVVAGGLDYGETGETGETVDPETAQQDLVLVAPDFEQFIYRFWVENLAWFEAVDEEREWDELSPPVRDYLAFYR